jgi:hypothetical protein
VLKPLSLIVKSDPIWHACIEIPISDLQERNLSEEKRVIIAIQGVEFQRALHSKKWMDNKYIYLSTQILKQFNAVYGDVILIEIFKDSSELQAPIPEEWQALIWEWPEIQVHFDALSIGKRRSLLFAIDRLKSSDARIRKALHFARKLSEGENDLKGLFSK